MIILYLAIGVIGGYLFAKSKYQKSDSMVDKDKSKEKIMDALRASEGKIITNDNIQMLLNVSDATATRYLDELEKEGKVEQIGKEGRFVKYRLK